MPAVSIIIPAYNDAKYLLDAIESALAQDTDDLEIIVVDDGSTDDTGPLIKSRYGGLVKYNYQENSGAPAARNRGIAEATGEHFIFLDADDALSPGQVTAFIRCSKVYTKDIFYGSWTSYFIQNGEKILEFERGAYEGDDLLEGYLRGWYIVPCSIFWPRHVLELLGGWDTRLLAGQDCDIVMRAIVEGCQFRFCPGAHAEKKHYVGNRLSISGNVSEKALLSRLSVLNKIESLLIHKGIFHRYRMAISERYYTLGRVYGVINPVFGRTCLREFKRIRGLGRPPGSIFNWIGVMLLGIGRKEKLAFWLEAIRKGKNGDKGPFWGLMKRIFYIFQFLKQI